MIVTALELAGGLALLLGGGWTLVSGASRLAARLGVSPMVVGLTVVAFGTSAPELVVNLVAGARGQGDVAFGNVIGSNLANVGLILGLTALVRPLEVRGRLIPREIPLLVLATGVALALVADAPLRGEPSRLDRSDGLVLLAFFAVFLYTMAGDALRERRDEPLLADAAAVAPARSTAPVAGDLARVAGGLAGLVLGGSVTVGAATALAVALSVPEVVVGLLVVSIGTSLPELVTSLVAVGRGQVDLAVGNVVGSNLFNLLFVLATTATLWPFAVPAGGPADALFALLLAAALLPFGLTHGARLVRWEGAVLLAAWLGYAVYRAAGG